MTNNRLFLALLLTGIATSHAADERSLVPPVRGAYLGWRAEATANPYGGAFGGWFGWREPLFESSSDWLAYNFMGIEFSGAARTHETHIGARLMMQPTSNIQASLDYRRIAFPWGIANLGNGSPKLEDRIWDDWDWGATRWGDEFTGSVALQKEVGRVQGRARLDWSRIDIDKVDGDGAVYIPSEDIPVSSRDDILRTDAYLGYRVANPFLSAWGLAYTLVHSVDADYTRDRVGVWLQAWPFSSRSPNALMRYWSARARLDIWLDHELRKREPRLEVTIGWEKNLLAPLED